MDRVGAVEIAKRLGVSRHTVDQWRQRGQFIGRTGEVDGRPAWDWPDVEAWWKSWRAQQHG
jgi:transposase